MSKGIINTERGGSIKRSLDLNYSHFKNLDN